MSITGIQTASPLTYYNQTASGAALPEDGNNIQPASPQNSSGTQPQTYDFTAMSRDEYAQLVKNGDIGLGPLVFPPQGIDLTSDTTQAQMDAVKDQKVDFIGYLNQRIEYNESINQPTEYYDKMLTDIMQLQGKPMTTSIDVTV